MSMSYIRRCYKVPAIRGRTVEYCGIKGIIRSARGAYLRVSLDDNAKIVMTVHPTWRMRYWLGDRWLDTESPTNNSGASR